MRPLSRSSRPAPAPLSASHAIPASAPARPLSVSPKPTSIGSQPPTGLHALDALEQALHARRPVQGGGLVHHSDRGVQLVRLPHLLLVSEASLFDSTPRRLRPPFSFAA